MKSGADWTNEHGILRLIKFENVIHFKRVGDECVPA